MREKITRDEMWELTEKPEFLLIYKLATTGLNPIKDHIIEVAAMLCMKDLDDEYAEIDRAEWFINPGCPLQEKVTEISGITDDFLKDKPCEAEIIQDITEYFCDFAVCGFNNNAFDDVFMTEAYSRLGASFMPVVSIDTCKFAPELISPAYVKNYRLATLSEHFAFGSEKGALYDVERIRRLLNIERSLLQRP